MGALVAVITAVSSARKNEVEVLRGIIQELQEWREEAKARIQDLEREVAEWKRRYLQLCDWVRQKGLEPPAGD